MSILSNYKNFGAILKQIAASPIIFDIKVFGISIAKSLRKFHYPTFNNLFD